VLYPQNGDRIVTIDSVTSLHPIIKIIKLLLVFLWWRCDMLCTFGFMGDVMLAHIDQEQVTQKGRIYTQTDPPGGSTRSGAESDIYGCFVFG